MKVQDIREFPNGTLLEYRGKKYFVSDGVEDRIVTDEDGHWTFVRELKWRTCWCTSGSWKKVTIRSKNDSL
jgi:hypothetical protein